MTTPTLRGAAIAVVASHTPGKVPTRKHERAVRDLAKAIEADRAAVRVRVARHAAKRKQAEA